MEKRVEVISLGNGIPSVRIVQTNIDTGEIISDVYNVWEGNVRQHLPSLYAQIDKIKNNVDKVISMRHVIENKHLELIYMLDGRRYKQSFFIGYLPKRFKIIVDE